MIITFDEVMVMMMMMHLLDAWLNHPDVSVNHSKERENHIST